MHYLYIIYSKNLSKYYVGETVDVAHRLELHNSHYFTKAFTKSSRDWEIKLVFACLTKEDVLFLEKFIKRMKSKKFNKKIIENPLILKDILDRK